MAWPSSSIIWKGPGLPNIKVRLLINLLSLCLHELDLLIKSEFDGNLRAYNFVEFIPSDIKSDKNNWLRQATVDFI